MISLELTSIGSSNPIIRAEADVKWGANTIENGQIPRVVPKIFAKQNPGCGNNIYIKTSSATPNLNLIKVEEKEEKMTEQPGIIENAKWIPWGSKTKKNKFFHQAQALDNTSLKKLFPTMNI